VGIRIESYPELDLENELKKRGTQKSTYEETQEGAAGLRRRERIGRRRAWVALSSKGTHRNSIKRFLV